jgi:hypothetical protein
MVYICYPSNGRKCKTGGRCSRLAWEKSKTLFSKITTAKRAGGRIQVVEYLSSKHKTLNSNSTTAKKKKSLPCMYHTTHSIPTTDSGEMKACAFSKT